jgi:hypothetical protein
MESTKEGLFTNTQNTNLDFIKLEDVVSILKNIKAQENRDIIFVIFFSYMLHVFYYCSIEELSFSPITQQNVINLIGI